MNVLSPKEQAHLKSCQQTTLKHSRLLMGFALPSSAITFVALTALVGLAIYSKAYQVSLFDASLRSYSGTCIALIAGTSPLLIYSIFLSRLHQRHKSKWIDAHKVILKDRANNITPEFIADELMKGMQRIDKQFLIIELTATYPNRKKLDPDSDEIKILDALKKAQEKIQLPPEEHDGPREDLGRRLREMDRLG
jgi:hypothetical protein